jgi:hypothetical protein
LRYQLTIEGDSGVNSNKSAANVATYHRAEKLEALTVLAVATPVPLSGLMIALAALSIVALAIRRQIPGGSATRSIRASTGTWCCGLDAAASSWAWLSRLES